MFCDIVLEKKTFQSVRPSKIKHEIEIEIKKSEKKYKARRLHFIFVCLKVVVFFFEFLFTVAGSINVDDIELSRELSLLLSLQYYFKKKKQT